MATQLKKRHGRKVQVLKTTIVREFDGGWDAVDNDLNLSPRFAKTQTNISRSPDGSLRTRYGTKLFADVTTILGADIVNMAYFRSHIISVGTNGNITKTDGTGASVLIFSDDISQSNLNTIGWGKTAFVSFTQMNGELILGNGIDKPLLIDKTISVFYLQDLGTFSNGNTPIARYCIHAGDFIIWGGDPTNETLLHISSSGTSGVYLNDPDPNDAIQLDLGRFINESQPILKGLGRYRDRLICAFNEEIVVVQLGVFNNSNEHVPNVEEIIEKQGCESHRSIQSISSDMLMADLVGVPGIERALFTGNIRPFQASELIDPEIQKTLNSLDVQALEDRVMSVYDKLDKHYMLFAPDDKLFSSAIDTRGFIFTRIKGLKVKSWWEILGWKWQAATRSQEGRIFFAKDGQIYVWGNQNNPIEGDFVGDQEVYSDGTTHTDQTGFNPVADVADSGIPIKAVWELPWADFDKRMNSKKSKYLQTDTEGDARFKVQMFTDNFFEDRSDLGEDFTDTTLFTDDTGFIRRDPVLTPELEMEFLGGEALGFGADFGNNFGGGRISSDERGYAWTSKFKIAKIRVEVDDIKPLRVISVGIAYTDGAINR